MTKHNHLKATELNVLNSRGQLRLFRVTIQICRSQIAIAKRGSEALPWCTQLWPSPCLKVTEKDSQTRGFGHEEMF